ncbi:hypothetical protein C8Q76DRAFT_755275 [Earliella scabrosa]|nr:hypothetical protein C8Q76DRAFT_755275 [Earliella scabrosa]
MSGYDERLLASAPAATRAEKQEGYNIDLLVEDERKPNLRSTSATPPPAVPPLAVDHSRAEAGGYPGMGNGYSSVGPSKAKPWYKTRKWLIIFLIGGIAVVAAAVGGAVGGTVGRSSSSSVEPATSTNTDAGDQGGASGPQQTSAGESGASETNANAPGAGQTAPTNTAGPPEPTSGGPGGIATTAGTNSVSFSNPIASGSPDTANGEAL